MPKPETSPTPAPKVCAACGRSITWRRKWARDWDAVRWCSDRCRGSKPADDDPIAHTILTMVSSRAHDSSVCPSEVARALWDDWRPQMEAVRQAARRLVAQGALEITQGGRVVDPDHARGPIRLRRPSTRRS